MTLEELRKQQDELRWKIIEAEREERSRVNARLAGRCFRNVDRHAKRWHYVIRLDSDSFVEVISLAVDSEERMECYQGRLLAEFVGTEIPREEWEEVRRQYMQLLDQLTNPDSKAQVVPLPPFLASVWASTKSTSSEM